VKMMHDELPSGSLKVVELCRLLSLSWPSDLVDGPVAFWQIYLRYLGLITVIEQKCTVS
jgi:hypothetical protein